MITEHSHRHVSGLQCRQRLGCYPPGVHGCWSSPGLPWMAPLLRSLTTVQKHLHFHQLADPAACHPHCQQTASSTSQSLETRGKSSVHLLSPNSKSVIPAGIRLSCLLLVGVGSPSGVYIPPPACIPLWPHSSLCSFSKISDFSCTLAPSCL